MKEQDIERFWSKVKRGADDDCWPWLAGKNSDGYGVFTVSGIDKRAHRIAYMLANGQIDPKAKVLHSCDNPPCCNPNHLHSGTQGDNNRERKERGAGPLHAKVSRMVVRNCVLGRSLKYGNRLLLEN